MGLSAIVAASSQQANLLAANVSPNNQARLIMNGMMGEINALSATTDHADQLKIMAQINFMFNQLNGMANSLQMLHGISASLFIGAVNNPLYMLGLYLGGSNEQDEIHMECNNANGAINNFLQYLS